MDNADQVCFLYVNKKSLKRLRKAKEFANPPEVVGNKWDLVKKVVLLVMEIGLFNAALSER